MQAAAVATVAAAGVAVRSFAAPGTRLADPLATFEHSLAPFEHSLAPFEHYLAPTPALADVAFGALHTPGSLPLVAAVWVGKAVS